MKCKLLRVLARLCKGLYLPPGEKAPEGLSWTWSRGVLIFLRRGEKLLTCGVTFRGYRPSFVWQRAEA
jgi:hypothetical protein